MSRPPVPFTPAHAASAWLPTPFSCDLRPSGTGASWVSPSGELDVATAPQLDVALRAAQRDAQLVVVDLRRLEFLDSAGVHVIVDAASRTKESGRQLVAIRAPAAQDAVFELTGTAAQIEMVAMPFVPASERATG